jgi:asparagine synthase (glutamine-hydrolysing)
LEVEIREEHLDLLPEIIYHMDMPIANSDIVGFFLLAKLARQHVKVILTGEGADELFGSYVHQELIYHGWRFKRFFPRPFLKGAASPLVEHMPMRLLNKFFRYPGYALDEESKRKLVEYVSSPDLAGDYFSLNALFSPYEKDALFSPEFRERFASESGPRMDMRSILSDGDIPDVLSKLIFLEFQYWLPTYHLVKEDKISMSQCIEQRFPFLDYELVEYVAGLPNRFKLSGLVRKAVLRKAAEDLLPSEIVWRPKGPILVPINKCFAKRFLIMVKDILSQEAVQRRGYFRYAYIQKLIQGREANPFLYDRQLFALLALEIWHRIFVDKGGVR